MEVDYSQRHEQITLETRLGPLRCDSTGRDLAACISTACTSTRMAYDGALCPAGDLHTSAWIPPLLALYYATAGGLLVAADSAWAEIPPSNGARSPAQQRANDLGGVALRFGCAVFVYHAALNAVAVRASINLAACVFWWVLLWWSVLACGSTCHSPSRTDHLLETSSQTGVHGSGRLMLRA